MPYRSHHNGDQIAPDGSMPGDHKNFPVGYAPRHRDEISGSRFAVRKLASRGTHRRWGFTLDGMSHAQCVYPCVVGYSHGCPRHDPNGYADRMARHAAGYDGTPHGPGSSR